MKSIRIHKKFIRKLNLNKFITYIQLKLTSYKTILFDN